MTNARRGSFVARLCATALVLALAVLVGTSSAYADPIADAKAQAAKVEAQVDALNDKAEIAAEQYNQAAERYAELTEQAKVSKRALKKVTAQKNALQNQLDMRATALYRQGPFGALGVLVSARTVADFDASYQMLTNASHRDARTVDKLKIAKAKATKTHNRLVAQKKEAAGQEKEMARNKTSVEAHLAESKHVLSQANAKVRTLIAKKKAAEAAAARARALRLLAQQRAERAARARRSGSGGSSHYSRTEDFGDPPSSSKGEQAVWYAEKKLGCRYRWGADGPNSFDCSGLTMWAYKRVGVSLPHYSRGQIRCGRRVSRSNLEPGDLVFFGHPIHHVGMYVGGGDFIEAPHSGARVRIRSLSRRHDYAGACRP